MKVKKANAALIIALVYLITICVSLSITFALVKLFTWCFGLVFSWKIALGVWVVILMFNLFFKTNKK